MPGRIEDYGLIGDLQTAALVGRDGSIDWLCLPRFDSPACFTALLDEERAGRWLLAPAGGGRCTRRRYRGDSLVLETEWETPEGTVRREATFTLQALLGTGYVDEAKAWREWLLRAVAGDPADLRIMYGLDGSRRIPEYTLDWLSGYEGSAPVRVGNAAAGQYQLDVWGEVLDGMHLAREAGLAPSQDAWDLQRALLEFLGGRWDDPDNSLWEMRGARQRFVHSKVMAWAFYGSQGLDAALLLIPRAGFLPWHDERVVGTIGAVQRELCEDGFLLRYRPGADGGVDGLPGEEGAFLLCSFWLADALHGIGREQQARALFERLLALRNDLGLLSEEYDTRAHRQLGNTPQAFSHVGLVNTARHLGGSPTTTRA